MINEGIEVAQDPADQHWYGQSLTVLGVVLEAMGRVDEAVARYEEALALYPEVWRLYLAGVRAQ